MEAMDFTAHNNNKDDGLLVKFFIKPKLDKAATEKEGRPIYKDVEHIDIKVAGSRISGAARPATKGDKERFPEHYAAFKNRIEDASFIEGTPLAEWPAISRSLVEELAFFHVKTVEQLSNMSDTNAGKFMGLMDLRAKAKDWLLHTKELQSQKALRDELDGLKENNDHLRQINESLEKRLNDLTAQVADVSKPKRGRPAKVTDDADNND